MDDTRTRDILDSLADLFLTNTEPPGVGSGVRSHRVARPDGESGTASGASRSGMEHPSPLDFPMEADPADAQGVPAKDTMANEKAAQGEGWNPVEALPQNKPNKTRRPGLRLADPLADSEDRTQTPDTASVITTPLAAEAVLLGNLPGFAGPWLAQYAQFLSEQFGPVAVVHLDHEQVDIEHVCAGGQPNLDDADGPGTGDVPGAGDESVASETPVGPADVVRHLTQDLHKPVSRLLLHLSAADTEALAPAALRALDVTDTWTIVTGVDDAAIVGAYQALKRLLRQTARRPQRIGLMVMGSDPEVASRAVANLDTTARSFLGLPINLIGVKQRMEPVNARFLGSFVLDAAEQAAFVDDLAQLMAEVDDLAVEHPSRQAIPSSVAGVDVPGHAGAEESDSVDARNIVDDVQDVDAAHVGAIAESPPVTPPSDLHADVPDASSAARVRPARVPPGTQPDTRRVSSPHKPRPFSPFETLRGGDEVSGTEGGEDGVSESVQPSHSPSVAAPDSVGERVTTRMVPSPQPQAASHGDRGADAALDAAPDAGKDGEIRAFSETSSAPNPDRTPALAGWLVGSVALEAHCPDEPGVELTLDEAGRIHVLAQCMVHGREQSAAAGQLARAAMSLLAARQWVARHRELLALTQRQCRFDPAAKPAMHLFTDHGSLARRLSERVGQTLHVHLLSPPSHSRQGWHSFTLA